MDARAAGLYLRAMSKPKSRSKRALLLGVAMDSDGHKRVTTGPNFALIGGKETTHAEMTEKAIKINEKLSARGKCMDSVSHEEFDEIAHEVGLRRHEPDKN